MDSGFEEPKYLGYLDGHRDWVTSIRTCPSTSSMNPLDTVFSTSRDKKLMMWNLYQPRQDADGPAGYAVKSYSGHSQPIQDLSISLNRKFALTASWDHTIRFWDLESGDTIHVFRGHTSDVNSVAWSPDNRQIISGSRDRTIKLWNVMAECKYTIEENQHSDWVSCTRFSPISDKTLVVSGGWDKLVKVWNLENCELKTNLVGHTGAVYTVTISPDGSLCASGGKDGIAMLWDVNEGRHLYSISALAPIYCLCFSPCHYWLCAATDTSIKIWNLEDEKNVIVNLEPPKKSMYDEDGKLMMSKRTTAGAGIPWCTSLTWSTDGQILFAGSTDGRIYMYDFGKD